MYSLAILKNFEISNDLNEELHQLQWNDKLAVISSFAEVQNDPIISSLVYCFKNSIHEYSFKIFMRDNFPLINELNRFIHHAFDCGLIPKWTKTFQYFTEKSNKSQYYPVSMTLLMVLSIICCGILLFASFVWILETIVHKKNCTQNSSPFWHFIEMMIDPYRHFLNYDLSFY